MLILSVVNLQTDCKKKKKFFFFFFGGGRSLPCPDLLGFAGHRRGSWSPFTVFCSNLCLCHWVGSCQRLLAKSFSAGLCRWLFPRSMHFGGRFGDLFPACAFFSSFLVISSHTVIPLLTPGLDHSGSVSWDKYTGLYRLASTAKPSAAVGRQSLLTLFRSPWFEINICSVEGWQFHSSSRVSDVACSTLWKGRVHRWVKVSSVSSWILGLHKG